MGYTKKFISMKIGVFNFRLFLSVALSIFILFSCASGGFCQMLSGCVLSADDSVAIPFATVYIPNTTEGVITDESGHFSFQFSPADRIELVASHASYKAQGIMVFPSERTEDIFILLREKSIKLDEIVVKPNMEEWQINYNIFKENLLSTTENAAKCKIINKETLNFDYDPENNTLEAWAYEPLIIENKALGYYLHYDLIDFKVDFNEKLISFSGHLFFREIKSKRTKLPKRWIEAREVAYDGSLLHLSRSIYQNKVLEQGFNVSFLKRIPNPDKPSEDYIRYGQLKFQNSGNSDSLVYYNRLANLPDQIGIILKDSVEANEIVSIVTKSNKVQFKMNICFTYVTMKRRRAIITPVDYF